MSLALTHASKLKPELRLAQAVSEFEAMLSQNQKAEIRSYAKVFDADDIMRLTAEIDRESTAKANERRRCYGPRVTSFLEGLHQFAETMDVAIGGATQNGIASGIWAVVRFSLLALTKYSPYIEKLSQLLMETSKSMPRVKELYKLFPRSKLLQDKFFEYYIVVVQLCQKLFKISQRGAVAQLWTAFAEEPYTEQLRKLSKAIHTEVYLETSKLIKIESKKQASFQFYSREHTELQRRQKQQETKQRILDACSQFDYRTIWKQTRKSGSTVMFDKAEAYHEWVRTQSSSCTLIYSGHLGSGKSVLLANIVDDLHLRRKADSVIAHFFCRHDVEESLRPVVVVGCLTRQLLQHLSDEEALKSLDSATFITNFDMDELVKIIKAAASIPVYFVLDGIDDMKPAARQELLKTILQLQDSIILRLCIATRSATDVFHGAGHTETILYATIPLTNPDIEAYIRTEVDDKLAAGTLVTSNGNLVQEIKEKLIAKSQGMFLWTHLQIMSLSSMLSDKQIREAIENLPEGLSETYSRLLQAQAQACSQSQYLRRLFQLVLAARRPLDYEEMREALSVENGNIEYDPENLINSLDELLRSCSGLVLLDEEEETLRLVHFSARQFLTTSAYTARIDEVDYETAMVGTILTYMNYSLFESRVTLHKPQAMNSAALPAAILINKLPMASRFIRFSRNRDLDTVLYNAGTRRKHTRFKDYATVYWDRHLMAVDPSVENLKLLEGALTAHRLDINAEYDGLTPLQRAVEVSCTGLVTVFLRHVTSVSDKRQAALRALAIPNSKVAELLLQQHNTLAMRNLGNLDETSRRELFNTALRIHDEQIINILLESFYTLEECLRNCIAYGDLELIDLLLVKSSDKHIHEQTFNTKYKSMENKTPWVFSLGLKRSDVFAFLLMNNRTNLNMMLGRLEIPGFVKPTIPEPLEYAIDHAEVEVADLLITQRSDYTKGQQRYIWDLVFKFHRSYIWESKWKTDGIELLSLLLKRGVLSVSSYKSFHPLFKAVFLAQEGIVGAILHHDPSVVNEPFEVKGDVQHDAIQGAHTAWDLCVHRRTISHENWQYSSRQFKSIQAMLESYGGRSYSRDTNISPFWLVDDYP